MTREVASRPEANPRLFVAFDVDPAALDALERSEAVLRQRLPRARWVPRANRHVTLAFLGATSPRLVEWVHRVLGEAAAAGRPTRTSLAGLGAFPDARRARVLWAGLDDPAGALVALAGTVAEALVPEFAPEKRPFAPHLTLARLDPPAAVEGLEAVEVESDPFPVDRIVLYRSHLRRPAPVYEPVGTFPLGR